MYQPTASSSLREKLSPEAARAPSLRIAMVITRSDTVAGVQVHVRDLSKELIARGHQVTVLAGGTGPFLDDLNRNQIPFISVPSLVRPIDPIRDTAALVHLRRHFKQLKPDLVSTHSSKAGWLGRLAARSLGLPSTLTSHGWNFTPGIPPRAAAFRRLAERIAATFTTRIIAVAQYDRELALSQRVGRPDQLATIHYGVPTIPENLHAHPEREPAQIIMVARLDVQKDHSTLFRALSALKERDWTVELVGDGPRETQMRKLANELGIAERIQFAGLQRDVAERLARSQLFALTTNYEGFPISILEAMRAGLPVVASDVAGVRESVQDGRTGLVVPVRDVAATTAALDKLLSSGALRQEMGLAGRRSFEERFTFEKMVDATVAVYREAIERRQSAAARR